MTIADCVFVLPVSCVVGYTAVVGDRADIWTCRFNGRLWPMGRFDTSGGAKQQTDTGRVERIRVVIDAVCRCRLVVVQNGFDNGNEIKKT